jgi:hypothetical protein
MGFPSWEFRGSSMLAAKEGPYNVRNNVMDNDKENIICGRTFEMVVGHWSSMNQPAGTPTLKSPCLCPVWEIARF